MNKLAIRNILRNKVNTSINIVGLTIAFAITIVLFSYAGNHYSYDKKVKDGERIFRLLTRVDNGTFWASTFTAFDQGLKDKSGVHEHIAIYTSDESFEFKRNESNIRITDPVYAESDVFDFFNLKIAAGNPNSLNEPNTAFITHSMAKKLFGKNSPIGETLKVNTHIHAVANDRIYTVVGVLDRNQYPSHLQYDIILSKAGFYQNTIDHIKELKVFGANIYVKLMPGADVKELESKLNSFIPELEKVHGPPLNAFDHQLQALKEIHFTTGLNRDYQIAVNKSHLNILLIVGFLLFAIAIFNFVIMSIAGSEKRMHQNSIMKHLGGSKWNLIKNSLDEILVSVLLSLALSIFILWMIAPLLGRQFLQGWQLNFTAFQLWIIVGGLLLITLLATTVATNGHFLFSPGFMGYKSNSQNRAVPFIVFQFAVLVGLVCFSIILNKQLSYIQNKDLGFHSQNVLVIRMPARNKLNNVFKERMGKVPGVLAAGTAYHYPGYRLQDMNLSTLTGNYSYKFCMMDTSAISTLGIKTIDRMSEIKNFSILINHTFYEVLNKQYTRDQLVNGDIPVKEEEDEATERIPFRVSAVTNDFHYNSLYTPIGNLALIIRDPIKDPGRFVLVRFNQSNTAQVIESIHNIGKELFPGRPLSPSFLNEQLQQQYQSEATLLSVCRLFSLLTILIANLGLLGFTLFTTQKRTKEIGIRKVNGARISEVLVMLNKDFIKWVAIAFVIATPIAYYAMNKWLENFAYKTELSWWIFALAGLLALGIALLTVSWQSWRAATRNPVEALRNE